MKILLFGHTGMLGSECKLVLSHGYQVVAPTKRECDVTNWDKVIDTIDRIYPDVIINCVGTQLAETSEEAENLIHRINTEGARNLAQGAARFNCRLVHVSCSDVFDGQKQLPQPYFEDDRLNPQTVLGSSKVESEIAVRDNAPDYVIVRAGWLYSAYGLNFVKDLVRAATEGRPGVKVDENRYGSPTWAYRLALQIRDLIAQEGRGTYHATSEGYCSQYEWGLFVVEKLGLPLELQVDPVDSKTETRITNQILENRLLKSHGMNIMVDWKKDLSLFLEKLGPKMAARLQAKAEKK